MVGVVAFAIIGLSLIIFILFWILIRMAWFINFQDQIIKQLERNRVRLIHFGQEDISDDVDMSDTIKGLLGVVKSK